jgi:hypothetical protein
MSAFQYALESADNAEFNEAPLANGEETHTVANAIAEAQDLAQEAADADKVAEDLEDEQEQAEDLAGEVEDTVAQEGALDPTAARILKVAFANIVGKRHAGKVLPATENFEGGRQAGRESTRIALEGIKDTLKAFWEAIKAQFKKVYAKVKDWMVKTFSAAKKLQARAEALQNKASSTVGSIEEKSFSFSQTKTIAVDGKYNEPGKLTSGLNNLRQVVVGTITELKKDTVDTAIDNTVTAIKDAFTGAGSNSRKLEPTKVEALKTAVKSAIKGATAGKIPGSVGDTKKYADQFGDSAEVDVTGVFDLPGGKAIIVVEPKGQPINLDAAVKTLKGAKLVLASDRYNLREVSEGDVKTLTTSQIDKVCDDVIEIAESVHTFEKNWKENDKLVEKIQREVDDLVKEYDQEDGTKDNEQRIFRNFCNSAVGAIRRSSQFKANLCQYGLTTGNAFLNYAERSLAQHKSK